MSPRPPNRKTRPTAAATPARGEKLSRKTAPRNAHGQPPNPQNEQIIVPGGKTDGTSPDLMSSEVAKTGRRARTP